jgi:protein O-mannosyl-transferase
VILPEPDKGPSSRAQTVACALALAAVTFASFATTLGHGFVNWDDDVYVFANPAIRSLSLQQAWWTFSHPYFYAYIPVTLLSHALDVALWGMSPGGHHLTNVLLHSANAVWVFLLGLRLLRAPRPSALVGMSVAAILFAIHPLRAESVSWVSDRKDLLCAFFFLPGVLAYMKYSSLRGTEPARRWYLASLVLFVLAVLSKSVAVAFPALLLLIDWLGPAPREHRPSLFALIREKAPFLLLSLALTLFSFSLSPEGKKAYAVAHLSGLETLLFPLCSLSFSIYKTLLPIHLSPMYPRVGLGWMFAALILVVVVTGICVFLATRGRKGALLAWLAYLLLLIPTVGGLSSGVQPVADRYSYLSTISLFLFLGAGISAALERTEGGRRIAVVALCGAVAVILANLTMTQASVWKSSTTLWGYVVANFPPKRDYSDAYLNLGVSYAQEKRPREARTILEKAAEIDPTNAEAFYNLGVISYSEGDREGAVELYRKATSVDPHHAKAFYNLAVSLDELGRNDQAIAAMVRAARLGLPAAQEQLDSHGIPWK